MTTATPDLFDQTARVPAEPIVVVARRTDPETSHEAAAAFEANQTKAQRSVAVLLEIVRNHGPLSDFQIRDLWAQYWGDAAWSYTLPCKARHWARQAGHVKHQGFGTHQGRKVRTWAAGRDDAFLEEPEICQCCGQKIKPRKKP